MRKAFIGIALATTLLTAPAIARDGSVYAGVEGGLLFGDALNIDIDTDGDDLIDDNEVEVAELDLDRGWDVDAVLGYDFGRFRLEAEGAYKTMGADRLTGATGFDLDPGTPGVQNAFDVDGDLNVASAMVNGLVDLGSDDSVNFYAGGGVGYAWVNLEGAETGAAAPFIDDVDSGFAWQLIGGLRAPVTPTIDLGLKYRYFNVQDVAMFTEDDDAFETGLSSHSVLASLLFNFGGAEPEPLPAPAPVRAAPPPPPPAPPAPQTRTCPDGTVVMASQACPVPPPPQVPRTGERG
jgi:opacity protein-like surface antigen